MSYWNNPWRRALTTKKTHRWKRRALLALEILEDRSVPSAVGYNQVNLASDIPGLASTTVPSLVNPWGVASSVTGPFWIADTGGGVSDLLDGHGEAVPLTVDVPSAGTNQSTPTSTVVNTGYGFEVTAHGRTAPSTFLFASIDGTISGWTEAVDISHAVVAVNNSGQHAVYTGLALATDSTGESYIYAANVSHGRIDVFDDDFQPISRPGAFQDPNLPAYTSPFNVQDIGGKLFVTYTGPQGGFVDIYDTHGTLMSRFASQGPLTAPWGVAEAPASFGRFGGDILIGNNSDGHINAYDPNTGAFVGQLTDDARTAIAVPGLWALTFGNGYAGGNEDTLFFTAGIDNDHHGLFGAIQPPQLRGADTGGEGTFNPDAPGEPPNYPLPPVHGPTPPDPLTMSRPTSVLLPVSESSLALAPTLTTVQQPASPTPTPTTFVVASLDGSSTTPARFAEESIAGSVIPSSTPSTPSEPMPINRFLDLHPGLTAPSDVTVPPRVFREINLNNSSLANRENEFVLPGTSSDGAVAESSSATTVTSIADDHQFGANGQSDNAWRKIMGNLLGVIAINVVAGYLPPRRDPIALDTKRRS
jgi:uncharacterized protein (TIGR03118 family)